MDLKRRQSVKKWMMICVALIIGLLQMSYAFAEETHMLSATLDEDGMVTIVGNFSIESGQRINLAILNSEGKMQFAGYATTDTYGNFLKKIELEDLIPGKYTIMAGAISMKEPVKTVFEYGTDSDLKTLEISEGVFEELFTSEITHYTAKVKNSISEVTFTPSAKDPDATIEINGQSVVSGSRSDVIDLAEGENTIEIVVTAQDGTARTYTVCIIRNFTVDNELVAEVSINVKGQLVIEGEVNSGSGQMVNVWVTDSEDGNVYSGTIVSEAEGKFQKMLSFEDEKPGVYKIAIGTLGLIEPLIQTCEFGTNASLKSLSMDDLNYEPFFSPEVKSYICKIPPSAKDIKLNVTAEDSEANITVNDNPVDEEGNISLSIDKNTQYLDIEVTAQDKVTKETYRITLAGSIEMSAAINKEEFVTLEGIAPEANELVSIMVMRPSGVIDYTGFTQSGKDKAFSLIYKAEDIETGVYKVMVNTFNLTRPVYTSFACLSSNNRLENLSVGGLYLSPDFDPDTVRYSNELPYSTKAVNISAEAEEDHAVVEINGIIQGTGSASGRFNLDVGKNSITVKVTAANGNEKEYNLSLYRYLVQEVSSKSSNNRLSSLTVSQGTFATGFNEWITEYNVTVPSSVSSVTLSPATQDGKATVKIQGLDVASGSTSQSIELINGSTQQVLVEVTAEDGSKQIYQLNIYRSLSSVAVLSDLKISQGALVSEFDGNVSGYSVDLSNDISSVYVTPIAKDAASVITINGTVVPSGTASEMFHIPSGSFVTITIEVKAQNNVVNTYTVQVNRAASDNTDLASISSNVGSLVPVFVADIINYSVDVPYTTSTIKFTPMTSDVFQTAKVNGVAVISGQSSQNIQLVVGSNEIPIVVTAQNGSTRTYTIHVLRAASNNVELGQLLAKSSFGNQFIGDVSQNTITFTVSNSATSIQLAATPVNTDARVEVEAVAVENGQWSESLALNVGVNSILVKVTGQDGITGKIYTVNVTRLPSSDATLSMLTTSIGNLSPIFSPTETEYNINVANDVTSISLTPTINENHAAISLDGQDINSGETYEIDPLIIGVPKVVHFIVRAEDATTTKIYTVTVNRGLSSNANLSGLTISHGELSTAFHQDTISYSVDVPNSVSFVSITPTAEENNATITVNKVVVTSGLQSQDILLNSGGTTLINVVVTAHDGTTKTYTVSVNRASSDNANLDSLSLSSGALDSAFDPDDTFYTVNVANSVTNINVTHTVEESHATVKVNNVTVASGYTSQTIALNPGNNTITLVVTAQSGGTKTYTVNVVRASTDNSNLSHLQVRIYGNFVIPLDTVTSDFDLSFANAVTSVEVVATAVENSATIKLNGADAQSGYWSDPSNLSVGMNTFTILVTAPDGITTKTYTIRMDRRAASDAGLDGLLPSSGNLNPAFDVGVTSYTLDVANDVEQITFTPTYNATSSGIKVDGVSVNSSEQSQSINLEEGVSKDVRIVVTAQDQITTETYTIKVTRASSNNADLSSLTINNGTLIPDFDKDTTDYTVSVGNTVTSITVTPTAVDAKSIQVNGDAVTDGSTSNPITLSVGNNSVMIVVQAQNAETKTYTITITRASSSNANLTSLIPSEGVLSPEFNAVATDYEVTVDTVTGFFAVTPIAEDSTAVIRVNNMLVVSGQMSGDYAIEYGDNLMTISVTAEDGTVKDYLVTVHRPSSSDATLSAINTNHGLLTPVFNNNTTDYILALERSVSEVEIWDIKNSDGATVAYEVDDVPVDEINLSLQVGLTYKVEVIVTAEDLTTIKTYTIMVTRLASDDATLASLTASSGSWDVEFDPETTQYQIDVVNATNSITLTPIKSENHADLVCKVDGNVQELTDGALEISLEAGVPKEATFILTAEDTTTIQTYTVVVTRAAEDLSNNAYLSDLSVSADGWLNLETFNPNTLNYTVSVANDKETVVLTPALSEANATMSYKLDDIEKGAVEGNIMVTELSVGVGKKVDIVVTAEDGTTQKIYTVNVVRSRLLSDFDVTYNEESYLLDLNTIEHEVTVTITEGSGMVEIVPVFEDGRINPVFGLSGDDTMTATIDEQSVTYTVSSTSNQEGSQLAMLTVEDGSIRYFVNDGEEVTISIEVTENGETRTYLIHLVQL